MLNPNHQANGTPFSPSIYHAISVADIKTTVAQLQKHEFLNRSRLETLAASQKSLTRDLGRLDGLRAHISSSAVATRSIGNGMLSNASYTANRISSAVRKLDLEQSRVKETLDVVEQVVELKACILGVTGSMGAPQDWETAASYLCRASKIPQDIVDGPFAEEIVPTAEVPDPPRVTLENAAESLRGLFLREFEKAAQEGNGAKVTRFFKLFPLIGKLDVGLDVYGRYVCQGVATRARAMLNAGTGPHQRKEDFFYVNALTKLFEHIAQIVEQHGGLVEAHYGPGRMVKIIERLQLEADVQGSIIIDTWTDERNIDRRLTDIKSYAFTFLVQSFLPTQSTRAGTPRTGSPANKGPNVEAHARENEVVDMKAVDGLLSEIALMLGRWSLYSKFIAMKCKDSSQSDQDQLQHLSVPPLLLSSSLNRKIAGGLVSPFNLMTTFFFRRSVEKAFQLDEQPQNLSLNLAKQLSPNSPHITSAVDDVMYILKQVVEKTFSTLQREVMLSVIPSVARVLSSDFIGMIQRKMRDECYPKTAVQNALPAEQTVIAFLVLLNSLDVATDYAKRIIHPYVERASSDLPGFKPSRLLINSYPFDNDATHVAGVMSSLLQSFESNASELTGDGVLVIFKNVIKPRLRLILGDTFRDTNYQSTQMDKERTTHEVEMEDSDESTAESAVRRQFQRGWDALTKPIARILTDRNFDRLLTTIVSYLGEVLEKRIWSYYGRLDGLGAVRLERDVATVIGIAVKGGRYGLRDAFTRCTQICMIMNMEDDEWNELQSAPSGTYDYGIEWRIDREERVRARMVI